MLENIEAKCNETTPIPTVFILGTGDPLNPYEGGLNEKGDLVIGADAAVDFRTGKNSCSQGINEMLPDIDPDDGTNTSVDSCEDCTEGGEVRLYTIENGGNIWPMLQGGQCLPVGIIGLVSHDFEASAEILDFFD